jgi:hypothetical protein
MSFPLASRQFDYITPPRAHPSAASAVTIGEIVVLAVSVTPIVINLGNLLLPAYNISSAQASNQAGACGNYWTLYSDGADLGVITSTIIGDVTGANAPVFTTNATVNASGIVASVVGQCWRIPAGRTTDYLFQPGQDLFMGIVASGNGQVRLYQSSPPNP